ncbi:MAG TPA: DMT family transporter, partial [Mycobacteriales bacterium]|nr:DMT family transporter [Mycobacteriales bacterium]
MCVIWGVPYLLIKVAVRDLTPASLVFLRTGLGALFLLPLAVTRGQLRPLVPYWRPLLAYTVAELAIPWFLLSAAERRLSSSLSGLLVAAVPLVGAVFGRLAGDHEPLGVRRLTGLLVGLGGVAALVGLDLGAISLVALLEVAVVIVGYALGPLILSRTLSHLPGLGVVAASLGLTAVIYAPLGILQLPRQLPNGRVIASVVVLATLCTGVAFLIFFRLIAEVGPVRATVITYVNPAVAVGLGVTFLHERFTVGIAVGFVLVLAGSVLATR